MQGCAGSFIGWALTSVISQPQGRPPTLAAARSSPVNIATTPGAFSAWSFLIALTFACACGERTKQA